MEGYLAEGGGLALYSFSGVVHRLRRSSRSSSATQAVHNAVAVATKESFLVGKNPPRNYFGFGSGTNTCPARFDEHSPTFDRSRNPNADTHTQVMTPNVSLYGLRPAFIY